MTLKELIEKRDALNKQAQDLLDKAKTEKRDLTEAEGKQVDGWLDDADKLIPEIKKLETEETRAARLEKHKAETGEARKNMGARIVSGAQIEDRGNAEKPEGRISQSVLETAFSGSSLKNFPNTRDGKEQAYRFGMWCLAGMGKRSRNTAQKFCRDNGLYHLPGDMDYAEARYLTPEQRASIGHQENINYNGGYLVPDEFNNMLIVLRETYGMFRKYAKIIPMTRDTSSRPRRTGGLTAYFVGEGTAGTTSTKSWDLVSLQAKKMMCLSLYSTELNEDAVINIGDDLAGEVAYAFAKKEDDCGFNGDGTSTYGGIVGLTSAFKKQSGTPAGQVAGSGSGWSGLVLSDFNKVLSLLPLYADSPNCYWFAHRTFYFQIMQKLQTAAGGTQPNQIGETTVKDGQGRYLFLGYPVVFCQILPNTSTSSQYPVFFGDMSLAVDFGNRRETTIAFSNSATIGSTNSFAQDALAIRGTERFDINVHDVGDNASTPGPIVTIKTS